MKDDLRNDLKKVGMFVGWLFALPAAAVVFALIFGGGARTVAGWAIIAVVAYALFAAAADNR